MQTEAQAMASYMAPVMSKEPTPLMLRQVPVPYLKQVWPHVAGMIKSVAERSDGRWTVQDMARRLAQAEWQLWVVYDGEFRACLATEVFHEPSGMKSARIPFCTGIGAGRWVGLIGEVEAWAKSQGCRKIEMLARKGWAKHLDDYKMSHVFLEKNLDGVN